MEKPKMKANETNSSDEQETAPDWMKSFMDFWQDMYKLWPEPAMPNPAMAVFGQKPGPGAQASLKAAMKKWQAFSAAMSEPESQEALFKSAGTMPELLSKLAKSTIEGVLQIQQKWMGRAGRLGGTPETYGLKKEDHEMFRVWTEIYEKEIQKFFRVPQLGLTRAYQEKFQQALDKTNIFQATMGEYISMLSLPVNKSFTVLDEQLAQMAESGNLPSDPQEYYRMWVKILEGHYMTMYQSPEYLRTLAGTMNALADYSRARDEVLEDILNTLPIPKRKEVDELEREMFEVKKRLRALESKGNEAPEKSGCVSSGFDFIDPVYNKGQR